MAPVNPDDTIPTKVKFKDNERRFTDVSCAGLFLLALTLFFCLGFALVGSSVPVFEFGEDGVGLKLSDERMAEAEECCANAKTANMGNPEYYDSATGICYYMETGDRRHLTGSDDSDFPEDGNIFEAFTLSPEIPATLISGAMAIAVGWVVLLRAFATPIVFATEFLKIVCFIYIASKTPDPTSKIVFFVVAFLYACFVVWKRERLQFAGKIISHSALALQKNPSMFMGLLCVKAFYILEAYCFILFMSKSVEVQGIESISYAGMTYDTNVPYVQHGCEFKEAAWAGMARNIIMFIWGWSVMFFTQARLSIVAYMIGSWHFHPQDMPSAGQAIKMTMTKGLGTVSFSAIILAIIQEIKKRLKFKWYHHCGPQCVVTAPMAVLACLISYLLETCFKMLTKFTLIIHVFSGLNFLNSAKKCFKLMGRHFEGGFITDYASTTVLQLGCYIFSLGITFAAWAWLDETYNWDTLPDPTNDGENGTGNAIFFYIWLFYICFNLYYPVLSIFGIILLDILLDRVLDVDRKYWVAPVAATFVGIVSMLFFQYVAGIILDTIDVCFVCYAVDKDNEVEGLAESEFTIMIQELPGYKKEPNPDFNTSPNTTLLVLNPNNGQMGAQQTGTGGAPQLLSFSQAAVGQPVAVVGQVVQPAGGQVQMGTAPNMY